MAYRIALFDADNTLLDFTRSEQEALCACLTARGIPAEKETLSLYSHINSGHWKRLEQGLTTRDRLKVERFSDFFEALGYNGSPEHMAEDYMAALSRQRFLIDGALELIQALHGHCRLYIITNGIASVQQSRLGKSPLAPYFDSSFISEEMGCAKPERVFFNKVAARIPDFDPREALVIGDSLTSDMEGGIRAGLDTCWYNPERRPVPTAMPITYTVSSLEEILPILLD